MLRDNPVPVDLKVVSALKKPMAIDIYWWLTKRVYNLHEPATISWQQLYQQFGSDSELKDFKRKFKRALGDVLNRTPIIGLKKFGFDDWRCGSFVCVRIGGSTMTTGSGARR